MLFVERSQDAFARSVKEALTKEILSCMASNSSLPRVITTEKCYIIAFVQVVDPNPIARKLPVNHLVSLLSSQYVPFVVLTSLSLYAATTLS